MSHEKSDPSSLSNPLEVKVLSSHLSLRVDFGKKEIGGYVDHHIEVVKEGTANLLLDSKALNIHGVSIIGLSEEPLEYKVGDEETIFGRSLSIKLPESFKSVGSKLTTRVKYHTTKDSSAIQWLEPVQTAGKKHPYLFSQCQAIHARSLVPCQDSPSNKIKYTSAITVPKPLTALMSATPKNYEEKGEEITYYFEQNVPIPTYLIAIAVGHLESREVGFRSKVWSEPEMVEKGAYEFANTEKFIKTGEDLLTPYVWGRYDILLLPPSFPYGGMENPQLTFVTPTLLAGDRSLENVIAHEIAHSWMGNLVTNRHWSEFFLNEGFTVFVERKILSRLAGNADLFDFEGILGCKHLQDDIDHFGATNPLTALRPNLDGIDPDDAFSSVPYEKGFTLLCYLQSLVGVSEFEQWLKLYVTKFQYQSITADQMKEFFIQHFTEAGKADKIAEVDWKAWLDTPGMPIKKLDFSTKLADTSVALAQNWVERNGQGCRPGDLEGFTTNQVNMFLDHLLVLTSQRPLTSAQVEHIDSLYGFTASGNSEIRFRWYTLCLRSGYDKITTHVVDFLTSQGRMKFVRPLYRELNKNESTKELARKTFLNNKDSYHAIASRMVAKDLGVE